DRTGPAELEILKIRIVPRRHRHAGEGGQHDERDVPQSSGDDCLTRDTPLDAGIFEEVFACDGQLGSSKERADAAANSLPKLAPRHIELWTALDWHGTFAEQGRR